MARSNKCANSIGALGQWRHVNKPGPVADRAWSTSLSPRIRCGAEDADVFLTRRVRVVVPALMEYDMQQRPADKGNIQLRA